MNFIQITNKYVQELSREVEIGLSSGEATEELSYRTNLGTYFIGIAKYINSDIATIPEPKNQGKMGRPDWRFHDTQSMGVFGYVEAKGIDINNKINPDEYIEQVTKYLSLGNPVILTDGIEFIIFDSPTTHIDYSILDKPVNWKNPIVNYDVEALFRSFFNAPGYRTITENQLVKEIAKRAKLLADEVRDLLELNQDEAESESEARTIELLKDLKIISELYHDKTLKSNIVFSGFISQMLTFGLLYAHRVIGASSTDPKTKYQEIHDFWFNILQDKYSKKLLPFKSLVAELKGELNSSLSRLGIWYDDARRLLAHIKLTDTQIEKPDFHRLYELFLSIYDPKTRFDYGAFYTPRVLANYLVELTEKIAIANFDSINIGAKNVKYIDPCCGTGTFIELLVEKFRNDEKPQIIGFEILPAPYALAHYRMTMITNGYPENVNIVLTNTLGDSLDEVKLDERKTVDNILAGEQYRANELASPPLTLIIGNPPSSDSAPLIQNEGKILSKMIDDFRPPVALRVGRQNFQKQLKNEFIKFLRWSMDRAIKSKPAIISLILPSSFAKHNSYKYAREYLIENLSKIWIVELDSDKRSGTIDQNLFSTLQGRLLLVGIVTENTNVVDKVNYKSIIELSKAEKGEYFKNCDLNLDVFDEIEIDKEDYAFKPRSDYNRDLYGKFWAITDKTNTGIFLRHCSGLKLAPTHLLVHASSGQLKRRSKYISKRENQYADIKANWYSGQSKPPGASKITDAVRKNIEIALSKDKILKYSYRPFLEANVLLDDNILHELIKLEGGGTRDRPEVRAAFSNSNVKGIALAPAPKDIGDNLHKFSTFCWNIPDNDLSARGNAHVFCNYFPDYKTSSGWDHSLHSNISPKLLEVLNIVLGLPEESLIDSIMFYAYAILSSDEYLQQFKGKLFDVAGDWPRIPITRNKTIFLQVAAIGERIAAIEREDFSEKLITTDIHFNEYNGEFRLTSFKLVEDRLELFDENKVVIQSISNLPNEISNFEISGYYVLREWLKMRTYAYFRKSFEFTDYNALCHLITKIEIYQSLIVNLDILVLLILENPNDLC